VDNVIWLPDSSPDLIASMPATFIVPSPQYFPYAVIYFQSRPRARIPPDGPKVVVS
jgi:hypothetical protein